MGHQVAEREAVLRDLQRRVAAAKRTRRFGEIRYPHDLQAKICEWVRAGGLAETRLGSRAVIRMPVASIGSDLLKALAHL